MLATSSLREAVAALTEQVVADRRHFHRHPELGFQEHETAEFVAKRLRELGIETRTGVAGTGVVGLIRG
ncbi:MAG TPA: amidohydrolase, partial [Ktedonobacterales bacterium]|nr:amidohydrolase [Ktedonobacterales bacterium]